MTDAEIADRIIQCSRRIRADAGMLEHRMADEAEAELIAAIERLRMARAVGRCRPAA